MKKIQKEIIIIWLKRVLGLMAVILWLYIIYTLSQSPVPFMEQAPYCMISTIIIFGLLSLVFKGIEYFEDRDTV